MATKFDTIKEIYQLKNKINKLSGKTALDLTDKRLLIKLEEDARKRTKEALSKELDYYTETYNRLLDEKKTEEAAEAYFSTEEGADYKKQIEQAIEDKTLYWNSYTKQTVDTVENLLQMTIGQHWGVIQFNPGYIRIGIINHEESTPERRSFYFGQDIELRYEQRSFFTGGKESFQTSCGSCGAFDVEGGNTIRERAKFYIGVGKILDNSLFLQAIKKIMKEYSEHIEQLNAEMKELRIKLSNPLSE